MLGEIQSDGINADGTWSGLEYQDLNQFIDDTLLDLESKKKENKAYVYFSFIKELRMKKTIICNYDMTLTIADLNIVDKFNGMDPFLGAFFSLSVTERLREYFSFSNEAAWNTKKITSKAYMDETIKNGIVHTQIQKDLRDIYTNEKYQDFVVNFLTDCMNKVCIVLPICKEMFQDERNWYSIFSKWKEETNYTYQDIYRI